MMLRQAQTDTFFVKPKVIYDQYRLIKKINAYFARYGGVRLDERGHCHGLSLLWLKRMAQGRVDEMYGLIKRIIDDPLDRLIEIDGELRKFVRSFDKKQNPSDYFTGVKQEHVSQILGAVSQNDWDDTYLSRKLYSVISQIPRTNSLLCISNADDYLVDGEKGRHSIAVFVSPTHYYLYDANYLDGRARRFDTPNEIVLELRDRLFSSFKLRPPAMIPLEIKWLQASQLQSRESKRRKKQSDLSHDDHSFFEGFSIFSYVSSLFNYFGTTATNEEADEMLIDEQPDSIKHASVKRGYQ